MKEVNNLGFVVLSIFLLLFLGAYFSPTYSQQIGYLQAFLIAGGLLFIASAVILVATLGSQTFSLYLAVLASIAIATFGVLGGVLVLLLTYVVWSFAFGVELLLVHNGAPTALEWFKSYYTYDTFLREYYLFYPMLWVLYFLLDVIPGYIYRDTIVDFKPKEILKVMKRILSD